MKIRALFAVVLSLAMFLLLAGATDAQRKHHRNISINTDGEDIRDCGQVRFSVDDMQVVQSSQEKQIPRSAAGSLFVEAPEHGGIQIVGWDNDEYAVNACLSAAAETAAEAQNILNKISLSVQNGRVTVTGPAQRWDWMAYIIIKAPRGVTLELESGNGPIGVADFSGQVKAKNLNGPLTINRVAGEVRADVVNGPIDVAGSEGNFVLNAQNGPLNVALKGSTWNGLLEGHTQNGPLNLKLPEYYQSPVRIDVSRHSPVECYAAQCKGAIRSWDQPNRIEFGGPDPVVKLSTVNGPVHIKTSQD